MKKYFALYIAHSLSICAVIASPTANEQLQIIMESDRSEKESDVVSRLLSEGADPCYLGFKQMGAIHYAARNGRTRVLTQFLMHMRQREIGDIECLDADSWTPLCHAAANGKDTTVRLLHTWGAELNTRPKTTHSPLHFAALNGESVTVTVLQELGANANVKDVFGKKPVDYLHSQAVGLLRATQSLPNLPSLEG